MKTPLIILFLGSISCAGIGCAKKESEAKAREEKVIQSNEEAAAKSRADAARKEMETLPKVFSTPDYLKKNKPAAPASTSSASPAEPVKK